MKRMIYYKFVYKPIDSNEIQKYQNLLVIKHFYNQNQKRIEQNILN